MNDCTLRQILLSQALLFHGLHVDQRRRLILDGEELTDIAISVSWRATSCLWVLGTLTARWRCGSELFASILGIAGGVASALRN